ncbi:hypothetical protein B0H10DRAFT_512737 [Mycena sp. CBHHK59/15]|nr:hypothetical protein B0H10DRAFT_512737 [Mycena sp. CBHHK59/15]
MFSAPNLRQDRLDHQLSDQNRLLLQTNFALQARLASIETGQALIQPASTAPTRGVQVSSRGGNKRAASVHTILDTSLADSELQPESFASVTNSAANDADLPSLGDLNALSPEQKKVRQNVQRYVSNTFRNACGIGTQDDWPETDIQRVNELTGEIYLTPYFKFGVTDTRNIHIFAAVAKQVADEFKDKTRWPEGLAKCGTTWDLDVLKNMAKASFPNFKRQ